MRVHAIHVQGLVRPRGVRRLKLETGYNLLVSPDPDACAGLRAALEALLYPESAFAELEPWIDRGSETAPRVGISLTLGNGSYRVIEDLVEERVHLGRFDPGPRSYATVSTDPAQIEATLAKAGLPDRDDLFRERGLGWGEQMPGAEPTPAPQDAAAAEQRAQLEAELARAESARASLSELEARASRLRASREHFLELERQAALGVPELERGAQLAERLEGLEARVEQFRTLSEARERERSAIGKSRLALLDERARLRAVPSAQRPWMWLGLSLGAAGVLAAQVVEPWLGAFALVGLGVALTALGISESARRRLRGIDTRLAALRVRERSVEREFESEGGDVRGLLVALGLESPEDLLNEAGNYRELQQSREDLTQQLQDARRRFPKEAEGELAELEQQLAALRGAPSPDELRARLAELPESEPEPAAATELGTQLVIDMDRVAERSGIRPDELHDLVAPVLPLYLRTLTGGFLRDARYEPGTGWRLRDENGAEVGIEGLPPVVGITFRCALVEALAGVESATFFVGPSLDEFDARSREAIARAFRRLGSIVQVVQLTREEDPWARRAAEVEHLEARD
jgi:hypothetical protein